MELTKDKLKTIIKEELLELAALSEVSELTDQETQTLRDLLGRATPAVLTALGISRNEES